MPRFQHVVKIHCKLINRPPWGLHNCCGNCVLSLNIKTSTDVFLASNNMNSTLQAMKGYMFVQVIHPPKSFYLSYCFLLENVDSMLFDGLEYVFSSVLFALFIYLPSFSWTAGKFWLILLSPIHSNTDLYLTILDRQLFPSLFCHTIYSFACFNSLKSLLTSIKCFYLELGHSFLE